MVKLIEEEFNGVTNKDIRNFSFNVKKKKELS